LDLIGKANKHKHHEIRPLIGEATELKRIFSAIINKVNDLKFGIWLLFGNCFLVIGAYT